MHGNPPISLSKEQINGVGSGSQEELYEIHFLLIYFGLLQQYRETEDRMPGHRGDRRDSSANP
jgi:hypothetical protein